MDMAKKHAEEASLNQICLWEGGELFVYISLSSPYFILYICTIFYVILTLNRCTKTLEAASVFISTYIHNIMLKMFICN